MIWFACLAAVCAALLTARHIGTTLPDTPHWILILSAAGVGALVMAVLATIQSGVSLTARLLSDRKA